MTAKEALEKLTNYKCSSMSEKIECKKVVETALSRLEKLEKILLDPKTDDTLWFCETFIAQYVSQCSQEERVFFTEHIETLGNLRFLIKQLKEGLLK